MHTSPRRNIPLSQRGKRIPTHRDEQGDFSRIIDDLWRANEVAIKKTDDPIERAFLYGRKDALNEMSGKI